MRRACSITETSKEQPSVREGKFQIGESGRVIQEDFCIFSHEACIHEYVDNQHVVVSLSIFYIFLTIGSTSLGWVYPDFRSKSPGHLPPNWPFSPLPPPRRL
jgi:hypothetical protein